MPEEQTWDTKQNSGVRQKKKKARLFSDMKESEDIIKVARIVNIVLSPSLRFSPREKQIYEGNRCESKKSLL
jgi:hypothetical protein